LNGTKGRAHAQKTAGANVSVDAQVVHGIAENVSWPRAKRGGTAKLLQGVLEAIQIGNACGSSGPDALEVALDFACPTLGHNDVYSFLGHGNVSVST
jgi:hypothetical protein